MMTEIKPAYAFPDELQTLFEEYTEMLVRGEPAFRNYLEMQNFGEEIHHLKEKYSPPEGRLYLAFCDNSAAGCVGLRRIDAENCEMKRLYVRPSFRGKRIGSLLVQRVIRDAREIGYRHMLLDTLPFLESALRLYKRHGFYETERYNDSPVSASIFLKLDL